MDHQISNELPPLQNPEQNPQGAQNYSEAPDASGVNEVQAGQNFESGVTQGSPIMTTQPAPTVQIAMPAPGTPASQSMPSATGMPQIADDADLIEKEWVIKAKHIIAKTLHDPYEQNKQVEQMKADYMKKRYNRDIKIADE